jgi:hypothetical protein
MLFIVNFNIVINEVFQNPFIQKIAGNLNF